MNVKLAALALAAAIGIVLIAPATTALGHANYSSSTPAFGAILTPPAPTKVNVFFTQDLNLAGTNSLNVLDPSNNDIDNNDMVIDPGNHRHMTITLQGGLAFGTYTVQWTTTSAQDGHTGSGSFPFQYVLSVGGVTSLADVRAPSLTPSSQIDWQRETLFGGLAAALSLAAVGGAVVYVMKRSS